ncbi:hypothetical protein JOM56_005222 [Amanita muscaria]
MTTFPCRRTAEVCPAMDTAEEHVNTTPPSISLSASPSRGVEKRHEDKELNGLDGSEQVASMLRLTVPCAQPTRPIPLYPKQVETARVSEDTPIFSRNNVSNEVVFPLRKPSSPSQAQRDSTTTSPNLSLVLEQMSSTWVWTKEQLQSVDLSDSLRSTFVGIRNSTLSNTEEGEQDKHLVPVRDPYDSWPYIRSALEQDVEQIQEESAEGEPVAIWKWILGLMSPKPENDA